MRNRTVLLIVGIVVFVLLATGGTVGAMALTHSGFMGNGYSNGMMSGQQGYQGVMSGRYNQGGMMGGYQQNPTQQGAPVTGVTHMNMQNFAYQYANMQVKVGTTVTWTNHDSAPHSVTFKNGMKDSGLLYQGQSFSYTFNTPGTYQYYCTIHPYMGATVTVVS
ncbi:MAG TPA: cupredoxin family copper-binding protein [Ktedonobacteraceae bacterium]|nr:cupredoxin family copper-binding protein [Ktedonobacteraceae bacterium]